MQIESEIVIFDSSEELDIATKAIIDDKLKELQDRNRVDGYVVLLHNDPINNIDYVIEVIEKVFSYSTSKALWLTLKSHFIGRCNLWSGSYEKAKEKPIK